MNGIKSVQKLAADAVIQDQATKEWAAREEPRKVAAAKKAGKGASKRSAAKKVDAKSAS